ncbi:MAG: hypothetical protein ACRECO_14185 [Xanthobacteraceae bacterium]
MEWPFTITLAVKLPDQVVIRNTPIQLRVDPARLRPATVTGKIEFVCKTPPDIQGCYCKMFDLIEDNPRITQELGIDAYATANEILGALQVLPQLLPGFSAEITPPESALTVTMRTVSTNDGKCYNVKIDCTLSFKPAALVLKWPPIPVAGANVPVPDQRYEIGGAFESGFSLQYRVCCCSWTSTLDELEEHVGAGEFRLLEDHVLDLNTPAVQCFCADYSVTYLRTHPTGNQTNATWKCVAEEGPCKWFQVFAQDANGNDSTFKRAGGRAPKERRP